MNRFRAKAWTLWGAAILGLLLWACELSGTQEESTLSFTALVDSLKQYDSVQIIAVYPGSGDSDLVFHGKVSKPEDLKGCPAPHYDGGKVLVSILGYTDGEVVYRVDRHYDGETRRTLDTLPVILPGTTLESSIGDIRLKVGDEADLPKVTVKPDGLSDKTLLWTAVGDCFLIDKDRIKAWKTGTGELIARLKADTAKRHTFFVTVSPRSRPPETIVISPDTLRLAVDGASKTFTLTVSPLSASAEASWHLADPGIASVTAQGLVTGLKAGKTKAWAVSLEDGTVADTALIEVSKPVAVASVRFLADSLRVFVGGTAESLLVEVLPELADPAVDFDVGDSAVAKVAGGRLIGLSEGETPVVARSRRDASKSDTLRAVVRPRQAVNKVEVSPQTVKLYLGASDTMLAAKVTQTGGEAAVRWTSRNPAVAKVDSAGKVSAVAPGDVYILAASLADSSKKDSAAVKVVRDMPRLNVGNDTTVPVGKPVVFHPVVTQDYGTVTRFKWDLDGDGAWDDSSDAVKDVSHTYAEEKDYPVRFSARDTEGNDSLVVKRVKAVKGPIVLILKPDPNFHTKSNLVDVEWSVNDTLQPASKTRLDQEGANLIKRSVTVNGVEYSAVITVYLDTHAPNAPVMKGSRWSNKPIPTWTWGTGGGGSGVYRCRLDSEDWTGVSEITDSSYTPPKAQTEETHTLYVQERDEAGNWSTSAHLVLNLDFTPPKAPKMLGDAVQLTNEAKPKWMWSRGGTGMAAYRARLDDKDMAGGFALSESTYVPESALSEARHTLYVQERDSAGNWSDSAFGAFDVDLTPPKAPKVTIITPSPTNVRRPTVKWSSGGNGGTGNYEMTLDTLAGPRYTIQDSVYTLLIDLGEGTATGFVRERDAAGNWSKWGSASIVIDLTPPSKPVFDPGPLSPLNSLTPTLTWKSGGGGIGIYRASLDDDTTHYAVTSPFSPPALTQGSHTAHLQERDSAGNWSPAADKTVVLSLTEKVGGADAIGSMGNAAIDMALDGRDRPYVAYWENPGIGVRMFDGKAWQGLPSPGSGYTTRLAFRDTIPYIAFNSGNNYPAVKRYVGGSWVDVVPANTSGPRFPYGDMSFLLTAAGVPIMAFYEATSDGVNARYRLLVLRGKGAAWDTLGAFPLEGGIPDGGAALTLAKDGTLWVAHMNTMDAKSHVRRWDETGKAWVEVGSNPTADFMREPSLAMGPGDVPYLLYNDQGKNHPILKTFSGGSWTEVGDQSQLSPSVGYEGRLGFDPDGNPVVAYRLSGLTVMVFKNNAWTSIGKKGFGPANNQAYLRLAMSTGGVPYLGFRWTDGGSTPTALSVWKTAYDP